jgi:glyoxylase-like metal-dependent hydrolase (beta-lactamase superfamily II)
MLERLWLLAGLALGLASVPSPSSAQEALRTTPAARIFKVGAMQVSVLRDGRLAVPNDGSVFGGHPGQVSDLLKRAGEPGDKIYLDIDVLLVRTGKRLVLIDTGYGPKGKSVLRQSLGQVQVSPSDITDILITHAHTDHVGGLVDAAGRPAFPRAVIHMSANEWRFMQHESDTRDIASAVRGQVRTFVPGSAVIPGIRSRPLYGHTPGHVIYELVSNGERLLDTGDTAHSSVISLARPEWPIAWDSDKPLGAKNRARELRSLASSHERIFAVHFPYPGVGYITARTRGFAFIPSIPAVHH